MPLILLPDLKRPLLMNPRLQRDIARLALGERVPAGAAAAARRDDCTPSFSGIEGVRVEAAGLVDVARPVVVVRIPRPGRLGRVAAAAGCPAVGAVAEVAVDGAGDGHVGGHDADEEFEVGPDRRDAVCPLV